MDEEKEDSLIVEDFDEEDSTRPSTGFEFAIVEENPELEDVVTDSSSMNSEIISATAEDFSEIVSGITAKELESVCSSFDTAC